MRKTLLLIFLIALTGLVQAAKITDTVLHVGPKATDEFTILHKDGGYLKKVGSQGDWLFSKDGVLEKKIGSGSGSGGSGGVNILLNSSFEDGLTNWSNTGGTFSQQTYTTGSESNTKFARFVATGAGQYVESDCTDKPEFLSGGGMADIRYTTTDSELFELKVIDCTTSDMEISTATVAAQIDWGKIPTQTFDLKDKLKLRLISLGAASIDFDEAYTGSNKGFIDGTELTESKTYSPYTQGFVSISGQFAEYIHLGNKLTVIGEIDVTNHSSSNEVRIALPGGLSIKSGSGSNPYNVGTWAQSNNTTVKGGFVLAAEGDSYVGISSADVYSSNSINALNKGTGNDCQCSGGRVAFSFTLFVNEFNSQNQKALTPEQADFFISASIGGANAIYNSAGPAEVINSSLDMVLNKGSAKIPCSGTNTSTGLTCSAGSEGIGIVFNTTRSGAFKVCLNTQVSGDGSTASGYRIVHTENNSQVVISTGESSAFIGQSTSPIRLCDVFTLNSIGEHTFRLFGETNSGSTTFLLDRFATLYERDATITVEMVNHNVSRPIINNMVSTSYLNGIIGNHCTIDGVSPTRDPDSELCNSWIDSTVATGHGDTELIFKAGVFSGDVDCQVSALSNARHASFKTLDQPDASGASVIMSDPGGGTSNDKFTVSCWSKRK